MGEVIDASDLFRKKNAKSNAIHIIKILKNHHTDMITLFKDLYMISSKWNDSLKILDAVEKVLVKIKKEAEYTKSLMARVIRGDLQALEEAELFAKHLKDRKDPTD